MQTVFLSYEIARLPEAGDNAVIATRRLEAGSIICYEGRRLELDYNVLEGHRFAVQPVQPGEALLSWGLPFGFATRPIQPGGYVVNTATLDALRRWGIDFLLPQAANFEDHIQACTLDEGSFKPANQMPPYANATTFTDYPCPARRGAGKRNMILLLGTTAYTGAFVRALQERLASTAQSNPGLDGVVALAHSEGALTGANNQTTSPFPGYPPV